jgi:hypothetical protein
LFEECNSLSRLPKLGLWQKTVSFEELSLEFCPGNPISEKPRPGHADQPAGQQSDLERAIASVHRRGPTDTCKAKPFAGLEVGVNSPNCELERSG